jgi:hypothetical protein
VVEDAILLKDHLPTGGKLTFKVATDEVPEEAPVPEELDDNTVYYQCSQDLSPGVGEEMSETSVIHAARAPPPGSQAALADYWMGEENKVAVEAATPKAPPSDVVPLSPAAAENVKMLSERLETEKKIGVNQRLLIEQLKGEIAQLSCVNSSHLEEEEKKRMRREHEKLVGDVAESQKKYELLQLECEELKNRLEESVSIISQNTSGRAQLADAHAWAHAMKGGGTADALAEENQLLKATLAAKEAQIVSLRQTVSMKEEEQMEFRGVFESMQRSLSAENEAVRRNFDDVLKRTQELELRVLGLLRENDQLKQNWNSVHATAQHIKQLGSEVQANETIRFGGSASSQEDSWKGFQTAIEDHLNDLGSQLVNRQQRSNSNRSDSSNDLGLESPQIQSIRHSNVSSSGGSMQIPMFLRQALNPNKEDLGALKRDSKKIMEQQHSPPSIDATLKTMTLDDVPKREKRQPRKR